MKRIILSIVFVIGIVFLFTNSSIAKNAFQHSTISKSKVESILKRAKNADSKFNPAVPKFYVCMFYGNLMKDTVSYGNKLKSMVTTSVKKGKPFAGVVAGNFLYLVYRDCDMTVRARRIQRKTQPALRGAMNKYGKEEIQGFVDDMVEFYNKYFDLPEDQINR